VDGFCLEVTDQHERPVNVVDLSPSGLRIQRPDRGWRAEVVQLEFEIPGIDEVMWASGTLRGGDSVVSSGAISLRASGIELAAATSRHRRMLRDYVMDTWRAEHAPVELDWLDRASCYMRG